MKIRTRLQKLTFEEYLTYEDNAENRCELIDGELVSLPPESELNDFIAQELFWVLAISKLAPRRPIRLHTCEIQVPVLQRSDSANRYPDLVVLREEHLTLTQKRLTVTLDMPPPRLVVEVVSPGKVNRENDYIRKRAQYAARGIGEYWIVDRHAQTITVLYIEIGADGKFQKKPLNYEETVFQGKKCLESPTFPELNLTPEQLFDAVR